MRGDRVEVLVDVGDGVRSFEVEATRDGRRVEVGTARGQVEVTEVTRFGRVVRSARFMAARVIAVVEHPASETMEPGPRRRRPPENQPGLGL